MLFEPADRTLDFYYSGHISEADPTLWMKLKSFFGADIDEELQQRTIEESTQEIRGVQDNVPFRLSFQFKAVDTGDREGYDVRVEATPTLLQKFRQLNLNEDYTYNTEDVLYENKDELERIAAIFGVTPYRGPLTEAEAIEPLLSETERDVLKQHRYGRAALDYINEGDRSLQNGLLHAALSCYIHAIEWTIICYKELVEDTDLVEEQKQDEDKHFTYHNLIQKIQNDTPLTQLTLESLRNFNEAERRWIAHHREGEIPRSSVENVRENLGKLVEELFRNYSTTDQTETTIE